MRGHIIKRAKDSWSIVIDIAKEPATGKRKQQWYSIKGTKKEAAKKLAEILHQLDTGTFIRPDKITLAEFLEKWQYIRNNPLKEGLASQSEDYPWLYERGE